VFMVVELEEGFDDFQERACMCGGLSLRFFPYFSQICGFFTMFICIGGSV